MVCSIFIFLKKSAIIYWSPWSPLTITFNYILYYLIMLFITRNMILFSEILKLAIPTLIALLPQWYKTQQRDKVQKPTFWHVRRVIWKFFSVRFEPWFHISVLIVQNLLLHKSLVSGWIYQWGLSDFNYSYLMDQCLCSGPQMRILVSS